MPSYVLPRRCSRRTKSCTSSTIQRTDDGGTCERVAFSFAHLIAFFDASTCVTCAPARALATVAPPVYANKCSSDSGRCAITSCSQFQFVACSGNSPMCLNEVGRIQNVYFLYDIAHRSGSGVCTFHVPPFFSWRTYVACAVFQGTCASRGHSACGSGRATIVSPQRSSRWPSPASSSAYVSQSATVHMFVHILCSILTIWWSSSKT